ncbi:Citrate/H+ symporter, CitMHS family OS=Tsukamurella paurometabola (strain ATCC 8368 / DSM /CCUG 35730 / CIP 100753 / JCM 10117 / KCTC 9821 / NBRC 16120/ NCIMB 702349 / NCTC 13040) OX=521096 GN=Tpau_1349 PE=4 SV=1 [Tsukamurella paurometabola]|uniref:Citrate/H+ symporter, CitMHS family n=1 Tax=Tsukamurella paurometabola (strain ATCC 8368 / DSM 20162 / CCUG 35730 / CIP 100753 / JCM 10117 / KCTC 9821 / NBRC 16120 / NCIMB 702349 / NCTC 13040) TaxID=521096 RepID=D5UWV6_TSUPD|nr:SLC13 family permease [Tsukamurella paurometabola]ADG77978.1 citrate/H+ symporter, CitMHS family [Tsukamurella paurometabola DSM 20162]SUP29613.1 Citrate transporter [Tsukamurella paurometabola]
MLTVLGLTMVAAFMVVIMTRRATPIVALIAVPVIFGLLAGAGTGIGKMITDGIKDLAPTAAMLFFAIVFFGVMIDVGLFDPVVRAVVRLVRDDPARLVLGTAVLAGVVSLDGDGSTTFIVTTSALLPLYLKLGVSPVALTVVAGLANGTMNILPWGGPTARAAAALKISPSEVFVPMIPSLIAGMVLVLAFAWHLGLMERKRIGTITVRERVLAGVGGGATGGPTPPAAPTGAPVARGTGGAGHRETDLGGVDETAQETGAAASALTAASGEFARPKLLWFNAALTAALLSVLTLDLLPIPVLFMIAAAIALIVNFPKVAEQQEAITRHSSSIVSVVGMVFAAAVLTGVFKGTGMVEAVAAWVTSIIPSSMGPHLAVITGVLSIPFTFLMSNDAFYFGILPVLSETASNYGISAAEMARASITGQPFHMQSPLVPAILLLVALAGVGLADHHKKVLWRAAAVSILMLVVGVGLGQIPF